MKRILYYSLVLLTAGNGMLQAQNWIHGKVVDKYHLAILILDALQTFFVFYNLIAIGVHNQLLLTLSYHNTDFLSIPASRVAS